MISDMMHSPPPKRDYENEVWECWRTRSSGDNRVIHLVGSEIGKSMNMTACGLNADIGWDHGSVYGSLVEWQGCRRCEAAYRVWAAKQKKVSADHE